MIKGVKSCSFTMPWLKKGSYNLLKASNKTNNNSRTIT